jgi:hypothetical protein
MLKEINIIASNSNSLKKKKLFAKVWKFGFKNIYPNYQTLYRYQSNCWLRISCQQNRSRNSDKNSHLEKFEATKCVFRSCKFLKLSKELNMFLLLRTTIMCRVVYRSFMKLHRFSCYFFIRHRHFQSAEKKIRKN